MNQCLKTRCEIWVVVGCPCHSFSILGLRVSPSIHRPHCCRTVTLMVNEEYQDLVVGRSLWQLHFLFYSKLGCGSARLRGGHGTCLVGGCSAWHRGSSITWICGSWTAWLSAGGITWFESKTCILWAGAVLNSAGCRPPLTRGASECLFISSCGAYVSMTHQWNCITRQQFVESIGRRLCRPRPVSLARRFHLHLQQLAFLQAGIGRGNR